MAVIRLHCSEIYEDRAIVEGVLVYGEEKHRERLLALQEKGYCVVLVLSVLAGLDLSEEELGEAISQCGDIDGFVNVCLQIDELSESYIARIYARCHNEAVVIYESDRIVVRESVATDGEAFCELYQDGLVKEYIEDIGVFQRSQKDYQDYIEAYRAHQYGYYEYGMYSLVLKESNACIGRVGLEYKELGEFSGLSLGYAIIEAYRGKGYVREACKGVLKDCFEQEYSDSVLLFVDKTNKASISVASGIGAELIKEIFIEGRCTGVWRLSERDKIV
ncbi:MAG: GNAT family N-acetyltransferase [Lachnospiraceae bacterium]